MVKAMVSGSNAMKTLILLGGVIGVPLLLVCLMGKEENKRVCSTVPAAVLASNPSLKRSYVIEKAKKECIEKRICRPDDLVGNLPCEFTAYQLKECEDIDSALADYKTAQRHLEAEVQTCELSKIVGRRGETVYQWIEQQ
jgi:hypothetical protein